MEEDSKCGGDIFEQGQCLPFDLNKNQDSIIAGCSTIHLMGCEKDTDQDIRISISSMSDCTSLCSICLETLTLDPDLLCTTSFQTAHKADKAFAQSVSDTTPPSASLQSTKDAATALTPCGHLFHAACITEAMTHAFAALQRPHCPLCRAPFAEPQRPPWFPRRHTGPGAGWPALTAAAQRAGRERCRQRVAAGDAGPMWWKRAWLLCIVAGLCLVLAAVFAAILVRRSGK
jgi:hypothetical protein